MKALLAKAASAAKSTFSAVKNVVGQAVAKVTGAVTTTVIKAVAPNVAPKVVAAAAAVVQVAAKTVVAKAVGSAQQVAAKSANTAKNAAIATANTLKAAAIKAKNMGTKAVGSPVVQCPMKASKTAATKAGSVIKDFLHKRNEQWVDNLHIVYREVPQAASRLKNLRVFRTANGGLRAAGMKAAFEGTKGMRGNTTRMAIFGKSAVDGIKSGTGSVILGLGKTGAIAAVISVADEGIKQIREGRFEPSKLAASGGTGLIKGIVTGLAYAGAVAGTVAIAAATVASAPVWLPVAAVAAGVVASVAVGYCLDKVDEHYKITDNLASGISTTGKSVGNFFGSVFKGSEPVTLRGPP